MNLYEILAQSVEHLTFNQGVPGSIPGYLRIKKARTITYCPGFFYIHRGRRVGNISNSLKRLHGNNYTETLPSISNNY